MITYDDENNSVVMEYMSPDGEHDQVSTEEVSEVEEDEAIELYNENFAITSELPENLYASETVPQEAESSANWPKVPSFFPQPDNNPDSLLLPQPNADFKPESLLLPQPNADFKLPQPLGRKICK